MTPNLALCKIGAIGFSTYLYLNRTTMRIFLDTNVVLTGAFNQKGPAGTLGNLTPSTKFLHSPQVLTECDQLIFRDAPTYEICEFARKQVRSFLDQLHSESIQDIPPPTGVSAKDPGDDLILGAAIAANADAICTYNIRDFPDEHLSIRTPFSIHRDVSTHLSLEKFIQHIFLSSEGTILFFGRLHHPSSMGTILTSSNGTIVTTDEKGFIHLSGPNVKRQKALKPLRSNEEFRLSIKYKQTDFDAALWTKASNIWMKDVLSRGADSFSEDTSPALFFVPNHNFFGHIQCISGVPRYVRDKQLISALDNYSLEAITGSLDLKWFLQRMEARRAQ